MRTFCILVFTVFSITAFSQVVEPAECEEIVKAIRNGEVNALSPYLANSVECDIFGKNNVCSKSQTVQIMKDFFEQNKSKQFVVNHQGVKGQTKFIIGTYTSTTGKKFRIACMVKHDLIQQIRIEISI
ncbi:MAG: DUF4783 domain-containing protein [Prevotellaceae bacterium]|jgi:hypothetical protein|nr:DUF4783 domain-containing protein [Prevotellaceae bacterium]